MQLRTLVITVSLAASGCARAPVPLLCRVMDDPSKFVGDKITLSGVAQMYPHASTMKSAACPDHELYLDLFERPWKPGEPLTPDAEFFARLAARPQAKVSIVGRIVRSSSQPNAYVFRVDSGIFVSNLGG